MKLKSIRKSQGLTLQELADKVGSSKAYMWQLENKQDPDPGVKLGIKLAKALCTTVEKLFGEDNETHS